MIQAGSGDVAFELLIALRRPKSFNGAWRHVLLHYTTTLQYLVHYGACVEMDWRSPIGILDTLKHTGKDGHLVFGSG